MRRRLLFSTLMTALAWTLPLSGPALAEDAVVPGEIRLSDEQIKLIELETATATVGRVTSELALNGEVTPDLDRMVEIPPRASGVVREVTGRLGEAVRANAPLAVVESSQIAEAEAAYLAARSRAALAQTQFGREEGLWKKKISAEQDYLQAKQDAAEAEIEFRTAERKLKLLGLDPNAKNGALRHGSGSVRLPVVAPFDGTLIEKRVAVGDQVSEATVLFRIANLDKVWVIASVHENDMGKVAVGLPAMVTLSAYADRRFEGRVAWVSDLLDEKTRTLKIRIELNNKERLLRPGSFARVKVAAKGVEAVTIPASAVQRQKAERIVFVEAAKGVFQRREVKVGMTSSQAVEIVEGLEAGERVVTSGAFALKSELEKSAFVDKD